MADPQLPDPQIPAPRGNLITIRDAIVTALHTKFGDWTVQGHGGRFTLEELPLLLGRIPLMLVANLGISEGTRAGKGEMMLTLRHAIYLLATDKSGINRDEWVLDAVENLLEFLMKQTWNGAARSIPELPLQAQNLYAKTVNNLRVAVWGIPFTQSFLLKE